MCLWRLRFTQGFLACGVEACLRTVTEVERVEPGLRPPHGSHGCPAA